MYSIDVWTGLHKREKQFDSLEEFILWECAFDWTASCHEGELHGTEKHEGWSAVKVNGAWTVNYKKA